MAAFAHAHYAGSELVAVGLGGPRGILIAEMDGPTAADWVRREQGSCGGHVRHLAMDAQTGRIAALGDDGVLTVLAPQCQGLRTRWVLEARSSCSAGSSIAVSRTGAVMVASRDCVKVLEPLQTFRPVGMTDHVLINDDVTAADIAPSGEWCAAVVGTRVALFRRVLKKSLRTSIIDEEQEEDPLMSMRRKRSFEWLEAPFAFGKPASTSAGALRWRRSGDCLLVLGADGSVQLFNSSSSACFSERRRSVELWATVSGADARLADCCVAWAACGRDVASAAERATAIKPPVAVLPVAHTVAKEVKAASPESTVWLGVLVSGFLELWCVTVGAFPAATTRKIHVTISVPSGSILRGLSVLMASDGDATSVRSYRALVGSHYLSASLDEHAWLSLDDWAAEGLAARCVPHPRRAACAVLGDTLGLVSWPSTSAVSALPLRITSKAEKVLACAWLEEATLALMTAMNDGTVAIWRLSQDLWAPVERFQGVLEDPSRIKALIARVDAFLVVYEGRVDAYTSKDMVLTRVLSTTIDVQCVASASALLGGTALSMIAATWTDKLQLCVFAPSNGKWRAEVTEHTAKERAKVVSFAVDRQLAVVDDLDRVHVWAEEPDSESLFQMKRQYVIFPEKGSPLISARWLKNGLLATLDSDGTLRSYNGTLISSTHHTIPLTALAPAIDDDQEEAVTPTNFALANLARAVVGIECDVEEPIKTALKNNSSSWIYDVAASSQKELSGLSVLSAMFSTPERRSALSEAATLDVTEQLSSAQISASVGLAALRRRRVAWWASAKDLRLAVESCAATMVRTGKRGGDSKFSGAAATALLYIAAGKRATLEALAKAESHRHPTSAKLVKLLAFDFNSDRGRRAAQKNAFALLAKKEYDLAAACFLLATPPFVLDAARVVLEKLDDPDLALTIARLHDDCDGAPAKKNGATRRVIAKLIVPWLSSDNELLAVACSWLGRSMKCARALEAALATSSSDETLLLAIPRLVSGSPKLLATMTKRRAERIALRAARLALQRGAPDAALNLLDWPKTIKQHDTTATLSQRRSSSPPQQQQPSALDDGFDAAPQRQQQRSASDGFDAAPQQRSALDGFDVAPQQQQRSALDGFDVAPQRQQQRSALDGFDAAPQQRSALDGFDTAPQQHSALDGFDTAPQRSQQRSALDGFDTAPQQQQRSALESFDAAPQQRSALDGFDTAPQRQQQPSALDGFDTAPQQRSALDGFDTAPQQRSALDGFDTASQRQQQRSALDGFDTAPQQRSALDGFDVAPQRQQRSALDGFDTAPQRPQQRPALHGFDAAPQQRSALDGFDTAPQQRSALDGFDTAPQQRSALDSFDTAPQQRSALDGFDTTPQQPQRSALDGFDTAPQQQQRSALDGFDTAPQRPQQRSALDGFDVAPQQRSALDGFDTAPQQPQQRSALDGFATAPQQPQQRSESNGSFETVSSTSSGSMTNGHVASQEDSSSGDEEDECEDASFLLELWSRDVALEAAGCLLGSSASSLEFEALRKQAVALSTRLGITRAALAQSARTTVEEQAATARLLMTCEGEPRTLVEVMARRAMRFAALPTDATSATSAARLVSADLQKCVALSRQQEFFTPADEAAVAAAQRSAALTSCGGPQKRAKVLALLLKRPPLSKTKKQSSTLVEAAAIAAKHGDTRCWDRLIEGLDRKGAEKRLLNAPLGTFLLRAQQQQPKSASPRAAAIAISFVALSEQQSETPPLVVQHAVIRVGEEAGRLEYSSGRLGPLGALHEILSEISARLKPHGLLFTDDAPVKDDTLTEALEALHLADDEVDELLCEEEEFYSSARWSLRTRRRATLDALACSALLSQLKSSRPTDKWAAVTDAYHDLSTEAPAVVALARRGRRLTRRLLSSLTPGLLEKQEQTAEDPLLIKMDEGRILAQLLHPRSGVALTATKQHHNHPNLLSNWNTHKSMFVTASFSAGSLATWLVEQRHDTSLEFAKRRIKRWQDDKILLRVFNSLDSSNERRRSEEEQLRYVDAWEVVPLEDAECLSLNGTTLSLGRQHYCEDTNVSGDSLWRRLRCEAWLVSVLASASPPSACQGDDELDDTALAIAVQPWPPSSPTKLTRIAPPSPRTSSDGNAVNVDPFRCAIRRHLYRNALFRRGKMKNRFLALIHVHLTALENLTDSIAETSPSKRVTPAENDSAYAVLRLKHARPPGAAAAQPLSERVRTRDSAVASKNHSAKSNGDNWGVSCAFRFALPDEALPLQFDDSEDQDEEVEEVKPRMPTQGPPNVVHVCVYQRVQTAFSTLVGIAPTETFLGDVEVPLAALTDDAPLLQWLPLRGPTGAMWFVGVRVVLSFVLNSIVVDDTETAPRAVVTPVSLSRGRSTFSEMGATTPKSSLRSAASFAENGGGGSAKNGLGRQFSEFGGD